MSNRLVTTCLLFLLSATICHGFAGGRLNVVRSRPSFVVKMASSSGEGNKVEAAFVPPTTADSGDEEEDESIPLEAVESLGRGSAKVRQSKGLVTFPLDSDLTLILHHRRSEASARVLLVWQALQK